MNTKVRVTANAEGNVVSLSTENPNYGFIRVEQTRMMYNDKGWATKKVISALIYGEASDLTSMGYFNGQELPGKIVIKESLEAFNRVTPEKDYKIAGKTGIICCIDGQPIYRKTFYNPSGNDQDDTIAHDNSDAIRLANSGVAVETDEEGFSL